MDSMEQNKNLDAIYLDYSKAFDKVDHKILYQKMIKMKIKGKVAAWLYSFVKDRKQTVKVQGKFSKEEDVVSGVPQGTVLGPLLFVIFINDIAEELDHDTMIGLFADDTRVSRIINSEEDMEKLQAELDKVYKWQELNNMKFNADKF